MLKVLEPSPEAEVRAAPAVNPPAGKLPGGCSLSLVTSLRSLRRLETHWRALEAQAHVPPTVFQSFDWVLNQSQLDLSPPAYEFGPLPVRPVPIPGQVAMI